MATSKDATIYDLVLNTGTIVVPVALDSDTVSLVITPTRPCRKLMLLVTNGGAGYDIDIVAGGYWAGQAMTTVTMAAEVRAFVFEAARFLKYQVNTAGSVYDYRIIVTFGAAATTTTYYTVMQLP